MYVKCNNRVILPSPFVGQLWKLFLPSGEYSRFVMWGSKTQHLYMYIWLCEQRGVVVCVCVCCRGSVVLKVGGAVVIFFVCRNPTCPREDCNEQLTSEEGKPVSFAFAPLSAHSLCCYNESAWLAQKLWATHNFRNGICLTLDCNHQLFLFWSTVFSRPVCEERNRQVANQVYQPRRWLYMGWCGFATFQSLGHVFLCE